MWIDSHCHLTHDKFEGATPADLVRQANENGVDGMLNISCRIVDEFPLILETVKKFENVWCTVGTHPHDAGVEEEKKITQSELVNLALSDPKIIGIGETGLDYYYNHSSQEDQEKSFRKHIRACIEADQPMVVHAREADEDIARIIKEEGAGTSLSGVMHCFSSGRKLAEEALDFGFYISFSGIVTFAKSDELRAIAKDVPLDRMLVETDAPFLAPQPVRGKTNQPAYVTHTGKILADFLKIDEAEFAKHTTKNFFRLFKRAKAA